MKYIVEISHAIVWRDIPRAIEVILMILAHVITFGFLGARFLRWHCSNRFAGWCVIGGLGLSLLGLEMVVLGYCHALERRWLYVSTAAVMPVVVAMAFAAWRRGGHYEKELREFFREDGFIGVCSMGILALVAVASLLPPREIDEREYHWSAPLMWADYHGWVATPFHNTNGPALGEMIYTFAAVFDSPVAAHWTHALCLIILVCGAIAFSEMLGGLRIAALGACLAAPVIVNQSSIAYTDVIAGALIVAAYAALFGERRQVLPAGGNSFGAICISCLIFIGAVSVKSNTLPAIAVACAFVAWPYFRRWRERPIFQWAVPGLVRAACLSAPVVVACALWLVHTWVLTGDWRARQKEIAQLTVRSRNDPAWHTGEAVARVPSLRDIIELPFLPVITPVLGQREPFGSRTGLLMYFAPLALFGLRRQSQEQKRMAVWLLVAAAMYYLLLGLLALKTRYFIFSWASAAVFASVAFAYFKSRPASGKLGRAAFYLLMLLGMADVAHVLLRGLTPWY